METRIIINEVIPGLNGSDGLMQEHYRNAIKRKERYIWLVKSQTTNKHLGAVSIEYIGYKSTFMDWDNFCASFKHLGDSLVACGVISDDNPAIVQEFKVKQVKSKKNEQHIEIIIKDL